MKCSSLFCIREMLDPKELPRPVAIRLFLLRALLSDARSLDNSPASLLSVSCH